MKFVNLTPHPVTLRIATANTAPEPDPTDIVIPPFKGPDGKPAPARVATTSGGAIGLVDGVAIFGRAVYGAVEGLPEPKADTIYIVSGLVAGRVSRRDDVFSPGTGPRDDTIRATNGQVFAVTRLVQA